MQPTARNSSLSTRHAVSCLLLAGVAWGGIWWWQSRQPVSPVESHLEAGLRHFRAGRGAEAEREWLAAIELEPKNATAWEALGDYYLATKQWEPCLKAYSVVAVLHPAAARLWTKIARAEVNTGNAQEARRHVDAALKSDPNDVEALNILTTLLQRAGESAQRVEILLRLAKLKPDDATILNKTADALMMRQRFAEAAPLVDHLLTLDPASSSAYAMRGAIAFNRDASPASLSKATADFQKAIALNNANWVARWYLGRSYLRLNQPAEAVRALKQVDEMLPADKNYLNDLATAYQLNGQAQQAAAVRERYAVAERQNHAIRELRSRLAAAPEDFDTNLQLGLLLLRSKNPDGAEDLLQKALKLRPRDARAQQAMQALDADYRRHLGQGLQSLQAKRLKPAVLSLARVLQLRPYDERTRAAVQQLAALSGMGFYQTVSELERLAQR